MARSPRRTSGRRRKRLQPPLSHAVAPAGHRGTIERQPVLEELLAAEVLVTGAIGTLAIFRQGTRTPAGHTALFPSQTIRGLVELGAKI
jgi:hypothetical protein